MHYQSEQVLVDQFTEALSNTSELWGGIVDFGLEFFYQRGKTDVVALSGEGDIIAFEAKLLRWREALHQAHRNTCFAHLSYVLLPYEVALRAAEWSGEFGRRGVGVCTLENGSLRILLAAKKTEPLQRWLSKRAAAHISGEGARDC